MPAIELTAKSVEEAQRVAAEKLGVELDRVTVKVLEEIKGLFGKSSVRVLAETEDVKPVAKSAPKPAAPAPVESAVESSVKAEETPVASDSEEAKPEKKGRGRPKKVTEPKPVDAEATPVAAAPEAEEAAPETEIVATEDDGKQLLALVESFIKASDLDVTVALGQIQGRYVNITLDGQDASYLVGKHGEVLNQLQYLVNIVGNRKYKNGVRATIECNDYRRKREEVLVQMATKIAEEVVARGEEALLDALPAFERRIVHKAIQDMSGVKTYSEGEEPNRRVVIAPED